MSPVDRSALRFLLVLTLLLPGRFLSAQSVDLAAKSALGADLMAAGKFDEAVAIYSETR